MNPPSISNKKASTPAMDPRAKLALGCLALAAVFIAHRPPTVLAQGVIVGLGLVCVLRRDIARALRLIMPMTVLVFSVGYLFFDPRTAGLMAVRLFNILGVSSLFFQSMAPEEVGDALRHLKVPYPFVFILTTAMRFVPLLRQKIRRITAAQVSRGIDLRPRLKNLPNFTALLIPLVVQAFILSDDLAVAMESRGFARKGRSMRRQCRLTFKDYGWMVLSLAGVTIFYIWERQIV
jgi:energy-coupling factor transport system permease protein